MAFDLPTRPAFVPFENFVSGAGARLALAMCARALNLTVWSCRKRLCPRNVPLACGWSPSGLPFKFVSASCLQLWPARGASLRLRSLRPSQSIAIALLSGLCEGGGEARCVMIVVAHLRFLCVTWLLDRSVFQARSCCWCGVSPVRVLSMIYAISF
jgi:hypothetical protein